VSRTAVGIIQSPGQSNSSMQGAAKNNAAYYLNDLLPKLVVDCHDFLTNRQ